MNPINIYEVVQSRMVINQRKLIPVQQFAEDVLK